MRTQWIKLSDINVKAYRPEWERVAIGVWLLTTLVLTRSYSGNLMSLLAVRIIPDPFDTLRDVLEHPTVVTVWRKYSSNHHYIEVYISFKNTMSMLLDVYTFLSSFFYVYSC